MPISRLSSYNTAFNLRVEIINFYVDFNIALIEIESSTCSALKWGGFANVGLGGGGVGGVQGLRLGRRVNPFF